MGDVTDALDALSRGDRSIEDVERWFADRRWRQPRPAQSGERPDDGSFAEVAYAYSTGVIDLDQYTRLAEVAAAAIRRQREQEDGA